MHDGGELCIVDPLAAEDAAVVVDLHWFVD